MDNQIAAAKMERIAKPIARPVTVSAAPQKMAIPEPLMVSEKPISRGNANEIQAPEGTPGVQPTLMERTNAENLIPTDPWETSPMFYEIANFFNIESKFYNAEKDKISVITDWAINKAGSNKIEDIYHTIRELEQNLMHMDAFEKPHNLIYRYLRLQAHADAANSAVRAFQRGPMTSGK